MPRLNPLVGHLLPIVLFGALAVLCTWPLPLHMQHAVIGEGAGDNLAFVWNFWWTRVALEQADRTLFWTGDLFAPLGTSLVLHMLTPAATVPAALFPRFDPVVAYNAALVATVFLNGVCAYAAAYAVARDRVAASFAGIAFSAAPFLLVRLQGHLNVLSAWGLPLLILALVRFERKPSTWSAIHVGAVLSLLVYTDYYYAIYGVAVAAVLLLRGRWRVTVASRPLTAFRRRILRALAALFALTAALITWIGVSGGSDTTVLGQTVRVRGTFNPRVAAWLTLAAMLAVWKWPRVVVARGAQQQDGRPIRLLPVVVSTTVLLILPVVAGSLQLLAAGDYVSQRFSWRSAPSGLDLASLAAGNPLGRLTGAAPAALYQRFGLDRIEGIGWIGLAPLVLVAGSLRRLREDAHGRALLVLGAVFLIWSLGPYLMVFGYNTGLMLPQTLAKFVPVLSNARIPGRGLAVVILAAALLSALALRGLRTSPRGRVLTLLAFVVLLADFWPRRQVLVSLADTPALYQTLKTQPPGAVLELPLGVRDSFGMRGDLDHRVLLYQSVHEHPLVGGLVARLSPRLLAAYENDRVLGPILRLSSPGAQPATAPRPPCGETLACAVRYVVVDEPRTSAALEAFVEETFRLDPVERNEGRVLYSVKGLEGCECR
jgi:hypothetical protein